MTIVDSSGFRYCSGRSKIPGLEPKVITPSFEISDSTAAIKAKRLMRALSERASADQWNEQLASMGIHPGISNTRMWRALLHLPAKSKDVIGSWYDQKNRLMDSPDPKKTISVVFVTLASCERGEETVEPGEEGLYLVFFTYERSRILNPNRSSAKRKLSKSGILLKVSLHVLQRLIQRGYGLSSAGEISYDLLLNYLYLVWLDAATCRDELAEKKEVTESITVDFHGARFVVKTPDEKGLMILATMLPIQEEQISISQAKNQASNSSKS